MIYDYISMKITVYNKIHSFILEKPGNVWLNQQILYVQAFVWDELQNIWTKYSKTGRTRRLLEKFESLCS